MLKKVIENIIFVILLAILGISISPALPFKNIPRTYMVISGSMEPTIKTGSIVLTKPTDPKDIKVGDIVAFTSPSNSKDVILHRVSAIKSESPLRFQTKGDNNNAPDAWDLMDVGILGKQVFAVPYIGHIAAFVRTPLGFGLIIVFPSLLFIISQILNIKKYIKQEIDKQVKSKTLSTIFFFASFLSVSFLSFTTSSILAKLSSTSTISGVSFSVKDFVPPPVPTLLSPPNNSFNQGSSLTQTWSAVIDNSSNPVTYIYESCNVDPGTGVCSSIRNTETLSGTSRVTTGVPNTYFWWRVKSVDALGNTSAWSPAWKLTVDNIKPVSKLDAIVPVTNQNPLVITYTATDNNVVDHTDLCYSFNLGSYTCGNFFNFNFPNGDGTYYFYSRAIDKAGNVEVDNISHADAVIYDTIAPTTNTVINPLTPSFGGQNLLNSANWITTGNVLSAGTSFQLGVGDSDSIDTLVQKILLPHNSSSNFTFSYNFTSLDYPEFDSLSVGVSTGTNISNILNLGGPSSTGWQTVTHSLVQWAGQTVDIFFKLINSDQDMGLSTSVILDNISVSPLDLRTGDTTPSEFIATDLGSGVLDSTTIPTTITSVDVASNTEAPHSISIVTLPSVVLNKITSSMVTLYNNTDSSVDLTGYSLDIGTTLSLTGTISPHSSLDFALDSSLATSITLKNNLSIIQDSTSFDVLGTSTWIRQSDGLGPWTHLNAPVSFDLQSRLSESKITLTISGLGTTLSNMDYTINYFGNGQDQQIAGTIASHTIDSNGTVSRDFYLGTCSSGSCVPATGIGSSFTVTFSDLPSKTFILN